MSFPVPQKLIHIRATETEGITDIRLQITHPMISGLGQSLHSQNLAAFYVREVFVGIAAQWVWQAKINITTAENPYWHFRVKGAKRGDKVTVRWVDNRNQTEEAQALIS